MQVKLCAQYKRLLTAVVTPAVCLGDALVAWREKAPPSDLSKRGRHRAWHRFVAGQRQRRHLGCAADCGQMAVELAVLVPVVIVVALVVANLASFIVLCARFDRAAPDMVCAHGVAPESSEGFSPTVAARRVATALEYACAQDERLLGTAEVQVVAGDVTDLAGTGGAITFPVSPLLTEYCCTLRYHPWPSSFVIAGVAMQSPVTLEHVRTLVVDRFRPGVVT